MLTTGTLVINIIYFVLLVWVHDNIRSSPCLAPRCRLILILTLEGLIVSQLKGYLSWVQTA